MARTRPNNRPQRIRIVAGQWRGRLLRVPPHPSVRPTPARVRETVFNWLAGHVDGTDCLDLFAGSGALGFEAASRGARRVTLVDQNRTITDCLRREVEQLEAAQVDVVCARALTYLERIEAPMGIIFLDPPFSVNSALLEKTCVKLAGSQALAADSRVYVESPADWTPQVPANWETLKSKRTGQVGYHLFAVHPVNT